MKPKFLITSLTSCSGCIASLMALDIFPQLLERSNIVYFPFIFDERDVVEADIALIEGCVSSESQVEYLKLIRKKALKVFALGTCAAFGGILSMSKKRKAVPISDYIEIDGMIPGCPTPSKLLGNNLIRLIENKPIELSQKNLCFSCPLRESCESLEEIQIDKLRLPNEEINTEKEIEECFLKKGILCLGPLTREGCDHECIKNGIPCEGCMGPVSKEFFANIINFLSLVDLSKDLKKYKGIFYRYSKPRMWK